MNGLPPATDAGASATGDAHRAAVVGFYDSHPINEDEILAKAAAAGADLDVLTQADLEPFDQDHYGGVPALEALADAAGLRAGMHVLDVCSGLGGPARVLAWRRGLRVTGVDLTASRVEGATRLTARVGLSDRVEFRRGDATALPFADAAFDAAISQEAFCHVPDKAATMRECVRVLRPGGTIAFTDVVVLRALGDDDRRRLDEGMKMPRLAEAGEYESLLEARGCAIARRTDLSQEWVGVLSARHAMYRSLRDTTVAKFGEARFLEYDAAYAHFVGLFASGVLGGVRLVARAGG